MATKPGMIVRISIPRGIYAPRVKLFIRNRKALKVKGFIRRGNP